MIVGKGNSMSNENRRGLFRVKEELNCSLVACSRYGIPDLGVQLPAHRQSNGVNMVQLEVN